MKDFEQNPGRKSSQEVGHSTEAVRDLVTGPDQHCLLGFLYWLCDLLWLMGHYLLEESKGRTKGLFSWNDVILTSLRMKHCT